MSFIKINVKVNNEPKKYKHLLKTNPETGLNILFIISGK
jgi:hypothetical protein